MPSPEIKFEEDFIVRQSSAVNYTFGVLCLLVVFISLLVGDYGWLNYFQLLGLFLIPAAYFLRRARQREIIFKINKNGFFHYGNLVTNWDNFVDARISEEAVLHSYMDHFYLVIRYYKKGRLYQRKIHLINTQDRGDEEVLSAIRFYYNQSVQKMLQSSEVKPVGEEP